MLVFVYNDKILFEQEFPYDICVHRGEVPSQFKSFDKYRIIKFNNWRTIDNGLWSKLKQYCVESKARENLFTQATRRLVNYKLASDVITARTRCFLTQDFPFRKKHTRQKKLLEALFERFQDELLVKTHPLHLYSEEQYEKHVNAWQDLCSKYQIPYATFDQSLLTLYPQVISFSSSGYLHSLNSDIVWLEDWSRALVGRQTIELEKIAKIRKISEEEFQQRYHKACWFAKHLLIKDTSKDELQKLIPVLQWHYGLNDDLL